MNDWLENLFHDPGMAGMGHGQRPESLDLGLGWIYFGVARALRPKLAVVIGSYRGFVPLVIAKAIQDSGRVLFIDPSLVDPFWREPQAVQSHFKRFGIGNIDHVLLTTQEFVQSERYHNLGEVGLLFVDGYHSAEQAQFDHEAFLPKMAENSVTLFHDSVRERLTKIYGEEKAYIHTACHYMDNLRANPLWEVLSFSEADGLTLVKRAPVR